MNPIIISFIIMGMIVMGFISIEQIQAYKTSREQLKEIGLELPDTFMNEKGEVNGFITDFSKSLGEPAKRNSILPIQINITNNITITNLIGNVSK